MELFPGIHQIPVNYKSRPLNLYLLLGPSLAMLMDTGDASVPDSAILPYFASIAFDPKRLTHIMATHPDIDHTGGLFRMKQAAPQAKFICGALDREQVESPEKLADLRGQAHLYWHGIGMDPDTRAKFIARAGGFVPFDQTFSGRETIPFSPSQSLEILHLPGHSHGHLGVFIPWLNTAIIGDAVQGTANRFLDGRAAFASTYMCVDEYLGTINRLQAMRLDRLYSCHWADCPNPAAVSAFLNDSRDYAHKAETIILETVQAAGPTGITLKELCLSAKPRLGDWPAQRDLDTRSMACGHLQRLVAAGILRATDTPPVRYIHEPVWKGLK